MIRQNTSLNLTNPKHLLQRLALYFHIGQKNFKEQTLLHHQESW